MAGSPTLHWGQLTVTVAQGETATVTSTATTPSDMTYSVGDTSIATATPNSAWTSWTIQGVSPGTTAVTINGAENLPGDLTITVTGDDDQNFLNERGLAHFWGNIDSAKQNKLTAGSHITINNDTISATQPTVNNATLTIQQNGTSLGTFTANASSNATVDVNAPKLTSLVGSVQTSDYHRSVVALCEVASGSGSTVNSWSSGKLVAHRNNGAYGVAEIGINIEAKRSTAYYSNVSYFSNIALLSPTANINTDLGFRPCTFKYNNVYYAGIEFYISSSSASNVYFSGVGNFDVFGLDYYSVSHGSTASSVLNSEVYNSLNYTQWNEEKNAWSGKLAAVDLTSSVTPATNVSIDAGGKVMAIGNIVVVNMNIITSATINAYGTLLSSMPIRSPDNFLWLSMVDANNANKTWRIYYQSGSAEIRTRDSLPAGTYGLSFVYIKA